MGAGAFTDVGTTAPTNILSAQTIHHILIMTYKELLKQLQQLTEEQLNQDVCIYNSWEDQHIQLEVDLAFTTEDCDVLDFNHPVIRF